MLFPAARFMIGPETIQERFGKEKIETKHHRDPGKSDPLQAQHRNAPGKRHHTLTETLPLDNQPLRKCRTPDHDDSSEAHVYVSSTHPFYKPIKGTFASRETGFDDRSDTNIRTGFHGAGQEMEGNLRAIF